YLGFWIKACKKMAYKTNYQPIQLLIDCQVHTKHLASFGAVSCARSHFVKLLNQYCDVPAHKSAWLSP
ncbi:MAG: hypothetical protein LUQ68_00685, partial [Methylococcaceae bacterium]|nr:hypothetical protein [Methylococcaceae bacterium]